jgi:hypothetical protein
MPREVPLWSNQTPISDGTHHRRRGLQGGLEAKTLKR